MHSSDAMQRLAAAVIRQAAHDAAGLIQRRRYSVATRRHGGSPPKLDDDGVPLTRERIQSEALTWLSTPSESLEFWCSMLGVDEQLMIDNVDLAIEQAKKISRMGKG